jgi:hypothetical protein
MTMHRALGPIILALALVTPFAASAQTAPTGPDSLGALTDRYFNAIGKGNVIGIDTTPTFHVIQSNGKRLSLDAFEGQIATHYLVALPPMGHSQKITSSTVTDSIAKETVDTRNWFFGAASDDPMSGPKTELDFATHQLTWVKSADGKWQLDEDHITWALST